MFSEDQLKWYDKYNKARPSHTSHNVSSDDITAHMKRLMPRKWKLEGNLLTGETDMGPLRQYIPTNVILTGVDENNLPIFQDVVIM